MNIRLFMVTREKSLRFSASPANQVLSVCNEVEAQRLARLEAGRTGVPHYVVQMDLKNISSHVIKREVVDIDDTVEG